MTPADLATLEAEIDRAHAFAAAGQHDVAVSSFDLSRKMAVEFADKTALAQVIQREKDGLGRERVAFRERINARNSGDKRKLLILSDSLALPRPNRMDTPNKGAENTYAWHLSGAESEFDVTLVAQRYYSTENAIEQLRADDSLASCDVAIIHLGLNDCANRIFLDAQTKNGAPRSAVFQKFWRLSRSRHHRHV